jgi:hypothetical protein
VGLTEKRIAAFREGGLDAIQLSFQDSTRELNDFLSSTRTFELKSKTAKLIKQYEYPMVLNVVLHRLNIDHIDKVLEMAEAMGAEQVELANTQYYSWAWSIAITCCQAQSSCDARKQSPIASATRRQQDEGLLRRAGLLRDATEGLHGGLGLACS